MRALGLLTLALAVVIGVGVGLGDESASTPARVPLTSTYSGATVHVAATGPCPSSLGKARDVRDAPDGLEAHLLPSGPVFGTICWYRSAPDRPYMWVHKSLVNGRAATALADAIAALGTARPPGVFSCPAAFGDAAVLAFGYLNGNPVGLWYANTGCQMLDNGFLAAYGYGPGAVAFAHFSSLALGLLPPALGGNGT